MAFNFLNEFSKIFKSYLIVLFFFVTIKCVKTKEQGLSRANISDIKHSFCNSLLRSKVKYKVAGAKTFKSNEVEVNEMQDQATTFRIANQNVYFWPSLTDSEKNTIRSAFYQISRRTCIQFNELDYKHWYHADRWVEETSYVIIKKSKKITGYSDNLIEGVSKRSLLYITETALNYKAVNQSRGMVMTQLLRFMGFREEHLRPDAPSYIQRNIKKIDKNEKPIFSAEQLQWPFDPESISIPSYVRNTYKLTIYCTARENSNIGAGQRAGLLTRWDAVKLNSMYCPERVGFADPRFGPCVRPRVEIIK